MDVWKPDITLNRNIRKALHKQISEPIQRKILNGDLLPGTLLENEVSLAERLQVSRPTARQALKTLVDKGLLLRQRGVGTVVAPRSRYRTTPLSSLYADIRRRGGISHTQILRYELQSADRRAAELLECPEGSSILALERLRFKDGTPIAILFNLLPARFAPEISELEEHGLYELLYAAGTKISSTRQTVGAEHPRHRPARLLKITMRDPILTIDRTAYDSKGNVVEWGQHIYRGDLYRYESTVFTDEEDT